MLRLIILTLLFSALGAESINVNPEALPDEARQVMTDLEESRIVAYKEYKDKVEKEKKAAIEELKEAMKESTKSGDLEAALAVRSQIKKLESLSSGEGVGNDTPATAADVIQPSEVENRSKVTDLGQHPASDLRKVLGQVKLDRAYELSKTGLGAKLYEMFGDVSGIGRHRDLHVGTIDMPVPDGAEGKFVGLVSRNWGMVREGGDYMDNVTFSVNGKEFTLDRWMPNSVILVPIPGGVIKDAKIEMKGPKRYGPRLFGTFILK